MIFLNFESSLIFTSHAFIHATKDRILVCINGQDIGDALGLCSEFLTRKEVQEQYPDGLVRYEQMIRDRRRSRWIPVSWTDDTVMMLCIAKARKDGHFAAYDVAKNFKAWFDGRHAFGYREVYL